MVVGCVVSWPKEGMMKEMERLCLIMALVGCANIVAATLQGACFKTFSERQLGGNAFLLVQGWSYKYYPMTSKYLGWGSVLLGIFLGSKYQTSAGGPGCLGVMIMEERGIQNIEYQEYQCKGIRNADGMSIICLYMFDGRLGVFQTFAVFLFVW